MGYQVPSVNQCYDFTCVIGQLQAWCCSHAPLVQSVYDECKGTSLSEQVAYLFGVVRDVVKAQQCVDENFKTLYDFVKDFFENLDLQEEVNKWLDEAYKDGRLLQLLIKNFPEYNKLLSLYKYPDIYVDTTDYAGIPGLEDTSLFNWDIKKIYTLYDLLLQENIFTKDLLGYGSNSDGSSDNNLPIYIYHYRGMLTENNGVRKPNLVVLTSGLHGNEKGSVYSLYLFVKYGITQTGGKLVNNFWSKYDFDIIPICNPFGFNNAIGSTEEEINANKGRFNARNVDLNRNFASGWSATVANSGSSSESELETKILTNYFKSLDPNILFSFSDWHTTFNDVDYDKTTQVYAQSTSVLNKNVDLVNNVMRDVSLQLAETQNILLSNQYVNLTNNLFMPTSGSMIGEFCFVTSKYDNCFIFEGGKRYYDYNDKAFIYNHEKNLISLSEVAYTTLARLTPTDYYLYNESINNLANITFINGDNQIGNSYNDIRKTSYAIISSDIITLHPYRTFKFYTNVPGYKVRILYLDSSNVINGDSGWQDSIRSTPTTLNKCVILIRKQNSQYIAPFMIPSVIQPILEITDSSSSVYNANLTSDFGTITYSDLYYNGKVVTVDFELNTTREVSAYSDIIKNLPLAYRSKSTGFFSIVCASATTSPTIYTLVYAGSGTLKNTSVIPVNTTIRGSVSYITAN